jgi:hypothetical protein
MQPFETGEYFRCRAAGPRVLPGRVYLGFHLPLSLFRQLLVVFEESQSGAHDFAAVLVPAFRNLPPYETFEVLTKANARHAILLFQWRQ